MGILLGSSLFAAIIIIAIITIHIVVITAIIEIKRETKQIRKLLDYYIDAKTEETENSEEDNNTFMY